MEPRVRSNAAPQAFENLGQWFNEHKQYACAVEAYRSALRSAPRSLVVLHGLAVAYLAESDYGSVIDLLRSPVRDEELTLDLASAYDKAGMPEKASDALVRAIRATPGSARLTNALVLLLAKHGELDEAYRLAKRFAELHPHDLNAQKLYLRVLVATNDSALSRPLARRLLAGAPADGELLYLEGVLERRAGEMSAARDHLQRSISINSEFPDSHYNLALVLETMEDRQGAYRELQKALSLGLADPEGHLRLSKNLRAEGKTQEAEAELAAYQQAIKVSANQQIASSKSAEAEAALTRGDAQTAVALYREALDATPDDARLEYELSVALDRAHDIAAERVALESAVRIDPALPLAQHQLGYLLSQAGDNDGAEQHFRLAVHADPDFTRAWISLAATLAMKSEFAGAKEAVNHALRLDPHNAEALQMRSLLLASDATH